MQLLVPSQVTLVAQAAVVAQSVELLHPQVEPRRQRGPGVQVAVQSVQESPLFPQVVSAVPSVHVPEPQQPWLHSVPKPHDLPQSWVDSQALIVGQSVVTIQPQVPAERQA
jgi:hypothetical protein